MVPEGLLNAGLPYIFNLKKSQNLQSIIKYNKTRFACICVDMYMPVYEYKYI